MSRRSLFLIFISMATLASAGVVARSASAANAKASILEKTDSQDALVERERLRLEELFIWKMTEELKLPVEKEASFSKAIRRLNNEKAKANLEVSNSLAALDRAQSSDRSKARVETEKALKRYAKAWRTYGALPVREVERLRPILGAEGVGRYLLAKSQMAERMKALSAREADTATKPETTKPEPRKN